MKITSRDNSLLRHARAARDGKTAETIFVEGLRLSEEALRSHLKIDAVIYSDQIAKKPRAAQLIRDLESVATKTVSVSEKLLESISYTKTPQGIVLLAGRPNISETEFVATQTATPLLVVMHRINNPVNVGAILRAAEAAGADGVITTAGTADPFSPKSLRGAMGSAFRLPISTGGQLGKIIAWCRGRDLQMVCADVHATTSYTDVDWRKPSALVLGPESAGLSRDEIAMADVSVRIPMKGATESLNVAVAAGIILFEASRQR
jgi:TrmH family RNA methyltransferase